MNETGMQMQMSGEPGIKIGIIGPEEFLPKMKEMLNGFPTFRPLWGGYTHENDAPVIAESMMRKVEILLFTGPIPYLKSKTAISFTVPVHHLPLTGAGLHKALFRLQMQHGLSVLSVDTLPIQTVQRTLFELGLQTQVLDSDDVSLMTDSAKLIAFHRSMYEKGASTAALTGIHSVAEALTAAGVPNEWVLPTDHDIIVALERALLSTESRRSKESQVVLGLIQLDGFGQFTEYQSSEHERQKLRLDIHRMLLDYVESLDGHMASFSGDEYLFITTRGTFERETGGYKYIPLARKAEKSFGLTLSIGIGFGWSASHAGTHARTALQRAKEAGGNSCYIIREDGGVIGPLEMSRPLAYNMSLIDPELQKKLNDKGMSNGYLSKLAAQATMKGKIDYLARELASVLGITMRSTHRCLNIWLDAGLVEIVGEQRPHVKGRPSHIYRISFLADQIAHRPIS